MGHRRRIKFGSGRVVAALLLGCLIGCGDDDQRPNPRGPGLVQVETAADLEEAFRTAVAGDTIQILSGFTGTTLNLSRGLTLGADRAPILLVADSRQATRTGIVFPDSVDGITITGHTTINGRTTTLRNIDLRGGLNGLVLVNSTVNVSRCSFKGTMLDGIAARGALSTGKVELCLFDFNNRFGISTGSNAALTIERNTIAMSGDCGLYIDSNAVIRANNVFGAYQYGIILQGNTAGATLTCNNAFGSEIGPNYVSATIAVDPARNLELDPRFCDLGVYSLRSGSPLAALNSPPGCGTIGAFEPECD